jgi:signal transduction histidine kinase/ligand-binding sensor domain-containing protein
LTAAVRAWRYTRHPMRNESTEAPRASGSLAGAAFRAFAVLLLLANAASGIDPRIAMTQYGHTAWRVRDGYFSGPPIAITQTKDGFLWIGTDVGLIRFDGVRFVPWQPPAGSHLPDDRIVNLLGASDGSLWIGTANGLARWHEGNLTVYARAGRFGALLEDRQGTIWAGHTRVFSEVPPLCRFERGEFRCFGFADELRLRYVGALHEDRQGNLWIGGETGACRWRPEGPVCFEISSLAASKDKSAVFALADDADGNLWAGTGATGTWRLTAGRWQRYPDSPEPAVDSGGMFSDRGDGLWIGTADRGLIRIVQGRTERFTRADGLSGDAVYDMFEDREGNVWVATSSGLDRFRDIKVATLTSREGLLGGDVGAVAASRDGSVWIAERRALLHLEAAGISVYRVSQGLPGNSLTSLFEDSRGRLWFGVDNDLAWREHGRFFQLKMPDGGAIGLVIAIAEDREGDLWLTTPQPSRALIRIRGERVVEVLPVERLGGQPSTRIATIVADPRSGLWIGLVTSELKLYRNGTLESHGSLGGKRIRSLLPEARGIWVATNRGLSLVRNGKPSTLDTRNGLPCNDIEDVIPGEDGSLWLKTACGLVEISSNELDSWSGQPERRVQVRVLDTFDGAQAGLSPFSPRSAKSLDGRLWFAIEGGGLQVFDPRNVKSNAVPPPVRILRLVADRRLHEPEARLRLPPLTRDLEIDYTALSFTLPEKIRFRYRLEGKAGGDWQEAGARREAFFTNLSPGSYRFHVIACNNDGIWNQEGAALDFVILPAFHQTAWFFGLCAALTAGLAWSAYRWRVRQVRAVLDRRFEERLAERTRVARELHDTLLQGFLSASLQLHVAVDELSPGEPAKSRFDRVQQLMSQVIEEGRQALRGLRSTDRSADDDLAPSLSRIPGELGMQDLAAFRVVAEGRARPLLPVVRDEIYRIAREALVNAFQHSGAATIEVEIEYAARQLRVVVRDDGRGIDSDVLRAGRENHWGLSGMRERAEKIGARLQVWSRDGSGTEVELAVPSEIAFADPASGGSGWWARWLPNPWARRP